MEKQEIEKLLRSLGGKETSRVAFSSYMDVCKRGNVVILKLHKKGLIDNMQTDAAAFESWALVIKAAFCGKGLPVSIRIDGEKPHGMKESEQKHYNRFLYRLSKFIRIFHWAYTEDFKSEIDEFCMSHTNMVINVPRSKAKISAAKGEATMERNFCKDNESLFDYIDHQLPVRIFDREIKEEKAITARGFIDAWAIKKDIAYVFELKLEKNRKIGAISELMYYVNIVHDILTHSITIPEGSKYRSFDKLKEYYDSKKCKHIVGRIIANRVHPLMALTNKTIADAYAKFDSPISIEIQTNVNDYIEDYVVREIV